MQYSPPSPARHRRRPPWLLLTGGAALCYLASYAAFSSWGQYVTPPATPDAPARWAPGEFYDFTTGRWKKSHTVVYAPLLWLDQRFWHPSPPPAP
jgi:hypothetical protein